MARDYVNVTCEGTCYLDEFETEALVKELRKRNANPPIIDDERGDLVHLHRLMREGRVEDATVLLERILWPKWRSEQSCIEELHRRKKQ